MDYAKCPHCGQAIALSKVEHHVQSRKFDHAAAIALVREGASQAEVASFFGVSRQAINHAVRRNR